jgi:pimeloyl-ACP methyl ester carboxylesterase
MTSTSRRAARRITLCVCAALAVLLAGAPAALARKAQALDWTSCGDAADVQCTTLAAPLDYDRPGGRTLDVHVARVPAADPANRIGTLFLNLGGPGAPMAAYIEAFGRGRFPALSARYDLVGLDPRGTGETEGAIDCKVDQETDGIYSEPFYTPLNLDAQALLSKDRRYVQRCLSLNDPRLLSHFSTANTARDMDLLRDRLGERKLNYLGFSYGTFLGATYATLFPRNYNRFVLDGPLDADQYVNDPTQGLLEQTSGFERALGRFFQACAADQTACSEFGGADPWKEYDALIDRANEAPIPASGYADDPRPVSGDDILNASLSELYRRQFWGELAYALRQAELGDGSYIRQLSDEYYGVPGTVPDTDRYFILGAVEQRYSRNLLRYFRGGNNAWGQYDHFYLNVGYVELNYGLWPVHDRDAYRGPFHVPASASTPLVVANTYDPATPFNGARRLVRDLGNARFLKVRADGHTAYRRTGPCADAAINGYLLDGVLPPAGTVCDGVQPFTRFTPAPAEAPALQRAVARVGTRAEARLQRPLLDR